MRSPICQIRAIGRLSPRHKARAARDGACNVFGRSFVSGMKRLS
ncbi:hypothetical protein BC2230_50244 [Burkholderia cepacia]